MYETIRNRYNLYLIKFLSLDQRKQLQLQTEGVQGPTELDTENDEEIKSDDSSQNSMSEQKRQLPPTSIDRSNTQKSFSQKVQAGEMKVDLKNCNEVANRMLFELNALAGRILLL